MTTSDGSQTGLQTVANSASPNPALDRASFISSLCPVFQGLLRGTSEINTRLHPINLRTKSTNSPVHISCHHIRLNGNQLPRTSELATFLGEKVVDYCIPRTELAAAKAKFENENSFGPMSRLETKARKLFSSLKKSGEGGEILLYILQSEVLGAPQLLCKMPLKTSTEMHYHGADSIHGKLREDGKLELYWGESKLYKNLGTAIKNCLSSIEPYLLKAAGVDDADRDLQLLVDNLDLGPDNQNLEEVLLKYLDPDCEESNQLEIKGACLIGFDCNKYPTSSMQKDEPTLQLEISSEFKKWEKTFFKKHGKYPRIAGFALEVFLVPFDSVSEFRKQFLGGFGITTTNDNDEEE